LSLTARRGGEKEGCRRQARRASRLGRSANQIDEKIDEIIDFAEIREFIDMPVQSYSSGMTMFASLAGDRSRFADRDDRRSRLKILKLSSKKS
jgi:hypothetical protein